MSAEVDREQVVALRTRVTIARHASRRYVEVTGPDAFDVLDPLVTADLYLGCGQAREALLLDEAGHIVLDLVVGRMDDAYLVGAAGPDAHELDRALDATMRDRAARCVDLDVTHEVVGLHGPYAWELLAAWLGADLVGMPHLSCDQRGDVRVVRCGKTGEYGYDVLLPRASATAMRARLEVAAAELDAMAIDAPALRLAALENGFFDASSVLPRVRCPLELQLGWRLSSDKAFRGSEAVAARRSRGLRRRATWMRSVAPLAVGDVLLVAGEPVGEIAHALRDPVSDRWLGLAPLPTGIAWPGVELDLASAGPAAHGAMNGAIAAVRTVAPPLLHNRSLHVSPQRHRYRHRHEASFPEVWT